MRIKKKGLQRFFSLLLMLCVSVVVMAYSRSVEEARNEAFSFLMSGTSSMKHAPAQQQMKLSYTLNKIQSSDAAAYLFQIGEDDGFVLVSAEDRAATILGYADEGYFDATDIPDNMQVWLQHYAEEITWASENSVAMSNTVTASAAQISPLLGNIVWNQGKPFWNQCPKDSDGRRSYTGCVATAVAQIMRYWNYPQQGEGSHSYTWTKTDGTEETLSADFGSTTYDWDKMLPDYNGSYSNSQANAVATLMYHLGVASDMEYTSNGSGTQTEKEAQALFTYFGYDKSLHAVHPDYVGFDVFNQKMLNELQAGRPVLMSGATVNDEGHAFVCDGYDGQFFHINWGWGGYQNGYFALSALDPEEQGMGGAASGEGYHVRILGVMGIMPDQGGELIPASLGTLGLRLVSAKTINSSDTFIIKVNQILNSGISDFEGGAVGLAVFDNEGYFISWFDAYMFDELSVGAYYPNEFDFIGDLSDVTDDGEYKIVPVFTDSEVTTFWLMDVGVDSPRYFSFTKAGDVITFDQCDEPNPGVEYSVSNLTAYADGNTIHFSFESDAPYYHVKIYDGQQTLANTYINFMNGSVSDIPDGIWTLWVRAADVNKNDVGEAVSTTVTVGEVVDNNVYNLEAYAEGSTIHFSFESDAPKFHVKVYNDVQTYANGIVDFKNVMVSDVPDGEWTVWVRPCDEAEEYYIADAVSTTVTVLSEVKCTSISLNKENITIFVLEKYKLTATVLPDDATNKDVTWSSSDTSVATVNQQGIVTAFLAGNATITATTTDGTNLQASCVVSVIPNEYTITYYVDGDLYKEYTLSYGATITPEAEPTKEGYTFSGWSEIPATMPAHDVVVNGSFDVNYYKISYFVDNEMVHQEEVAFGETIELWIYVPEEDDLIFNGWIGERYDTMPAFDISYQADLTCGINLILDDPATVLGIFTLDGKKVETIQQGIYIIRMKDNSTKKIMIK